MAQEQPKDVEWQVPDKVQVGSSPVYLIGQRLGKGGFGQVCHGVRAGQPRTPASVKKPTEVAVKFEHKTSKGLTFQGHPYEWDVYAALGQVYGLPKVHYKGRCGDFFVLIMDRLGPSLWDLFSQQYNSQVSNQFVACIAIEAIHILQSLHAKGFVHGDVKPENFVLGQEGTPNAKKLYLVDLGLTMRYKDAITQTHVKYHQRPDDFRGTVRYASVHAHLGRTASRRDDLESLAYSLLFLLNGGRLPWQGFQGDDKGYQVVRKKMLLSAEVLTRYKPTAFKQFTEAVINLRFDEEPKYAAYISMFEALAGAIPSRVVHIDRAIAVGTKRGRQELNALNKADEEGGTKKRKIRLGTPHLQWISIYNKAKPMKQRYHYSVSNTRLDTHVDKGYSDGLYISSVCASESNLWAIIMDTDNRYTHQVYKVSTDSFMPKEWIVEQWELGYYITAATGNNIGGSLVVMSKGTTYSQQSYKVSTKCFPFDWVKKKWKEGYFVTTMATAGASWAVVMSRCSEYLEQCVEIDFQYPSEGIHYKWGDGYRITSCAGTADQSAFILSRYKTALLDDSQETLRTSTFPAEQVKEKWGKEMYIAAIGFGRTVS